MTVAIPREARDYSFTPRFTVVAETRMATLRSQVMVVSFPAPESDLIPAGYTDRDWLRLAEGMTGGDTSHMLDD